ncbi:VWA domain-containing protein [Spiroplasma endosymbiont of Clivina fossor]|uniref:VWA domain-containing protein n=1 Tax=Spiroplasma endosymbiont of Clivina fossor TaxID=3066282 RepID=UPI00313DA357
MIKFLENAIDLELKKQILRLKEVDKNIASFQTFKTNFKWLATAFDDEINHFYASQIEAKIISQSLSVNIKQEIYLYYWIRENGIKGLKDNYEKVYFTLEKVLSPFVMKMNYYHYLLNDKTKDLQLIFQNFINNWEQLLIKRVIDFKLASINELRKKYLREVYDRIEVVKKFRRLYGFIWNFFGRFWDGNVKEIEKLDLTQLQKLANFLQSDPAIMTIAKLLGRLKGQSDKLEAVITEKINIEYEIRPASKWPEEIIGITENADLEHLLPMELVHLNIPNLQPIFYKKFLEKKLSTFEFISNDVVTVETITKVKSNHSLPETDGPFILCIDTSASMRGEPEYIAKALSLAIVKLALKQRRDCYMINFSDSLEVFDLTTVKSSLKTLVKFLSHSFHSSTNITPAIVQTINVMNHKKYQNADVLIISDFLTIDLSSKLVNQIKEPHNNRNRFHSITIGNNGNEQVTRFFDNNWIYDPQNPFTKNDIIADLEIKTRSKSGE